MPQLPNRESSDLASGKVAQASADNTESASALSEFREHAIDSFKYTAIQAPVSGVVQIIDHVADTKFLPKVQFFQPPKPAEVGTAAFAGEVVGSTAAGAIPLIIFHKMVGAGAASKFEQSATYGLNKGAAPALIKSAKLGAVFGGVLTPSDENGNFLAERVKNAGVSALTMVSLTAGTIGLKASGSGLLRNDVVSSAIAGAAAGEISADTHSLLSGRGLASSEDRIKSIVAMSVGGALNGGANILSERILPTSGIRGVRTLEDMTKLADSTRIPDFPKRYAFEPSQANPLKAEQLMGRELPSWYDRTSVNLRREIDKSIMPEDWRKQIVGGHQDFTYSLDALANRPNPKPILTVYGSARFAENDFRYQRARYIGGRAVQEGYDVMTGGGPGTMEGANRGAYEAGGNSIGVVLKLPHEKRGNGYQTLTLTHRNFFTRMEVLKKAQAFTGEDGGIGTAAENLDTLTHIQTGKLGEIPVGFIGKEKYGIVDKLLQYMVKDGTVSPRDRDLYRIFDDPDAMFRHFAKVRARNAEQERLAAQQSITEQQSIAAQASTAAPGIVRVAP